MITFPGSMMEVKISVMMLAMVLIEFSLQLELKDLLTMKRRPVMDRKIQIPQEMFNLYTNQMNQEYQTTDLPLPGRLTASANTMRSYTHQESPVDQSFQHKHKFRLNFDLTDFPKDEVVTSSELKLTVVPSDNSGEHCSHQRVSVFDIIKPGIIGKSTPILRVLDTKLVNTSHETISLDVLPAIHRWLSHYKSNYGLMVEVRTPTGEKVVSSHVRLKRSQEHENDDDHWHNVQPLLFVYSDDTSVKKQSITDWRKLKRRKRSVSIQPKSKRRARECRREQLWVDFEKVGWNDWIVAPPGYDAYYCAGDCPAQFGDHLNTTNHAIVQSLVHSVYPSVIPKPCCVPTALTSISMLYLDENNKAVLKNYPDMVVEGCGCR